MDSKLDEGLRDKIQMCRKGVRSVRPIGRESETVLSAENTTNCSLGLLGLFSRKGEKTSPVLFAKPMRNAQQQRYPT